MFTKSLFIKQGFVHVTNYQPNVPLLWVQHILNDKKTQTAYERALEMPTVIPLRHPFMTEESYRRRGRPVKELIRLFPILMERFIPLDLYIMPVDSPERENCLQKMRDGMNLPFSTDWEVVNGYKGTHRITWKDCNPSKPIQEIAETYSDFLDQFYY